MHLGELKTGGVEWERRCWPRSRAWLRWAAVTSALSLSSLTMVCWMPAYTSWTGGACHMEAVGTQSVFPGSSLPW